MAETKPDYSEIALEMYESVEHAKDKERRLLSSTFWHDFRVKKKTHQVVDRIERILKEQGLSVSVKSGRVFGKEGNKDWIVLNKWPPDTKKPIPDIPIPSPEWFNKMKTREFGSEREVEYYFILPMLEKLGYDENEIAIGYSIMVFSGGRKTETEADLVAFNGSKREKDNVLLVVEAKKAKKNVKGITIDQIGQIRDYAKELLPACYIITNGQKIMVFRFNGGQYRDKQVMDFDRSMLAEKWLDLYDYASKKATIQRKIFIETWWENQTAKPVTS